MTTPPPPPPRPGRSVRHAVVLGSRLHDTPDGATGPFSVTGPFTSQTEADLHRRRLVDTGSVEAAAAWVVPLTEPPDPGWRISTAERQRRRDTVLAGDLIAGLDRDEVRVLADAASITAALLYRVDAMYPEPNHPRSRDIERLQRLVGLLRYVNDARHAIEAHEAAADPSAPGPGEGAR